MTEEIKRELIECGVDYPALVNRFMNMDKLAEKFLIKFLSDPTMDSYKAAVDAKDADALFKTSHTLKGVSANLCINSILDVITPAVEIYRNGSTEGADEVYAEIKTAYDKICAVIKTMT